jgi:hypothetical protein
MTQLVITGILAIALHQPAQAQTEIRRGILPFNQLLALSQDSSTTLSQGFLADLQTDPGFNGDFQTIFNTASGILNGYTIVSRGGYFPENAGIPREQQLTTAEAVYYIFQLDNGNQLYLFRSPNENTSRYFIRQATSGVMMQ